MISFNDTLTNDIVSFEQLDPGNLITETVRTAHTWHYLGHCYHIYPEYLDGWASANNADLDQTAPKGKADQGLHYFPFSYKILATSLCSLMDV